MTYQYSLPCRHETEGLSEEKVVADYHPLSVQEVIELLSVARDLKAFRPDAYAERASIQNRLLQSIPGITCPHPEDGPVLETIVAMNRAFTAWIADPDTVFFKDVAITETTDIVVTLTQLMNE